MRRLALISSTGLLLACPGDDTMSSTATSSPQTGTADGSTSMSDATDSLTSTSSVDTGSASGSASGDSTTSMGSTDTGTATDTGPSVTPCGFEDALCMFAEGKTEPIDCGIATLADDAAAWQAASSCALDAAAAQEGFKVAFQFPSDDSLIFEGFYGTVGFAYGTGRVYTDTFGDPMLGHYSCTNITPALGCIAVVATHCLQCEGEGEVQPLECVMP